MTAQPGHRAAGAVGGKAALAIEDGQPPRPMRGQPVLQALEVLQLGAQYKGNVLGLELIDGGRKRLQGRTDRNACS